MIVEHAGHACEQLVAEDEVDVLCERDSVGGDGWQDVGDADVTEEKGRGQKTQVSGMDGSVMSETPDTGGAGSKGLGERFQDGHAHRVGCQTLNDDWQKTGHVIKVACAMVLNNNACG